MAGEERNLVPKVQIKAVEKIYEGRNGKTVALNGVNLDIYVMNLSVLLVLPVVVNPLCLTSLQACTKLLQVKFL